MPDAVLGDGNNMVVNPYYHFRGTRTSSCVTAWLGTKGTLQKVDIQRAEARSWLCPS